MKKKIAALLVCTMAAVTIFAGCGSDETEEQASISTVEEDDTVTTAELLDGLDYDVTDYVTLPADYMELTVELSSSYEVTDGDVREYIEEYILPSYPVYVETDKTEVEEGDTVNIDYVGTQDGVAFDGGTAEGYDLTIGSGTFIDGFEDGLIGVAVGDTVDLDLTFPEDYSNEDLAGQDVVFTVTVNSIVEEQTLAYDDMTDDYIAENFSAYSLSTVEDMYNYIEDGLTSTYESEKTSETQDLILEQLMDICEVDIPDDMLSDEIDSYISNAQAGAEYYGMDFDEYISTYYGCEDEDAFNDYATENATVSLTEELILQAIIADQGLTISRSDFDDFVDYFVSYYGYSTTDDIYEDYGGEESLMLIYAENVALNTVMDAATVIVPETGEAEEAADEDGAEDDEAEDSVADESEDDEAEDAEE
ncbi:MAG: trigger factor [Clostridiales bacterium]|nr:trigger factor [Clostridiales bacterium]